MSLRIQKLKYFSNELENILDEHEEPTKLISVHDLVDEAQPDVVLEPLANEAGKKKLRKNNDESDCLVKPKKKRHDSISNVCKLEDSGEVEEIWYSITKFKNVAKVGANCSQNVENDDKMDQLFRKRKKKNKEKKNTEEIGMQIERVMAILEIALEDDITLNKEGKPAINKLMNLPLLNGALSKKQLQADFLDHGVLKLLKNWLELLPDGSLPNINIRTAILNILNDLCIDLDQDCRKEQLKQSGLGKVIIFLSQSDEETTHNRRLATNIVNKWSRLIYRKSTRYKDMYTRKEQKMVLKNEIKKAPKVSKTKATDFNVDIDFSRKPKYKQEACRVGRVEVPKAVSMDFKINPKSKIDKELEALVKMQILNYRRVHERINAKMRQNKKRKSLQASKPSVNGRTMLYL